MSAENLRKTSKGINCGKRQGEGEGRLKKRSRNLCRANNLLQSFFDAFLTLHFFLAVFPTLHVNHMYHHLSLLYSPLRIKYTYIHTNPVSLSLSPQCQNNKSAGSCPPCLSAASASLGCIAAAEILNFRSPISALLPPLNLK